MSIYSIGQVAKQSGISVETIRYYEKEGLLEEPERKESGYRQYKEEAIDRLTFIQQAKELGFSLKEIGELLSIKSDANTVCNDVKQLAQEKLADIESKIKMLQRMRKSLKKLVDICPGHAPINDCPILEALDKKRVFNDIS
jgi:MerR family transcriptional regulator, copper efflux regulator